MNTTEQEIDLTPAASAKRNSFIVLMRLLLTLILLAWIGHIAVREGAIDLLKQVSLAPFMGALTLHILSYLILLTRWKTVLGIYYALPITTLWKSFYIGLLSNIFLPSSVGGDIVRGALLAKIKLPIASILICSVVDRAIGLGCILLIGSTAALSVSILPESWALFNIHPAGLLLLFVASPFIMLFCIKGMNRWVKRKGFSRLAYAGKQIENTLKDLIHNPIAIVTAGSLSILNTFTIILCYYLLTMALSIDIPLTALCLVVPISAIAASIPISIGGLGVREGTTILLLSHFGMSQAQGIALAGLYLITFFIVTAPAALLMISQKRVESPSNHT